MRRERQVGEVLFGGQLVKQVEEFRRPDSTVKRNGTMTQISSTELEQAGQSEGRPVRLLLINVCPSFLRANFIG